MALGEPGDARGWIDALGLEHLPGESGWWAHHSRSALEVLDVDGVVTAASSSIYYLLDARKPVNYWHWLAGDDTHVLVAGGPVEYVVVPESGPAYRRVLGRDLGRGQAPVVAVPGRSHKALTLLEPTGYALMVTVVTPAWTPESVVVGPPGTERLRYPDHPSWLTPARVAELTAPAGV